MIALIPWFLLAVFVVYDEIKREIERNKEYKRIHYEMVDRFECLYPDNPCNTEDPVFGIECDNCVRFYRKKK